MNLLFNKKYYYYYLTTFFRKCMQMEEFRLRGWGVHLCVIGTRTGTGNDGFLCFLFCLSWFRCSVYEP